LNSIDKKGKLYVIIAYLLFNVYCNTVNYFLRLRGRFGSSATGALGAGVAAGASPNAGGVLLTSVATGAEVCAIGASGTGGGVQVC
jgi:hypothetical protein